MDWLIDSEGSVFIRPFFIIVANIKEVFVKFYGEWTDFFLYWEQ